MTDHPARFSDTILGEVRDVVTPEIFHDGYNQSIRVLDPFAGTGRIHALASPWIDTVGVELEPEWADMHEGTIVGDATALPFATESFDVVATSPCYGNRMADHHNAKDDSKRITYRHSLGRKLSYNNAGAMQWGDEYKFLHTLAWFEAYRVLIPRGLMVVNLSNHIRKGKIAKVTEWHLGILSGLFLLEEVRRVRTPRMRRGANYDLRVDHENILVLRKPW